MTAEADRLNGVLSLTGGDPERARQLRANIAIFARRLGDPEMTRMVNEVLAGRRNVREVFRTPQFREVASRNFDHLEQGLERLPGDERERLLGEVHDRVDREQQAGDQGHTGDTGDTGDEVGARLHALRDRDLPASPVGPDGDVEPDAPRPRRR